MDLQIFAWGGIYSYSCAVWGLAAVSLAVALWWRGVDARLERVFWAVCGIEMAVAFLGVAANGLETGAAVMGIDREHSELAAKLTGTGLGIGFASLFIATVCVAFALAVYVAAVLRRRPGGGVVAR